MSDIQYYFEYISKSIIKKHEILTGVSSIQKISKTLKLQLYLNKARYHPEYLAHKTEILFCSIGTKINEKGNGANVPYSEITKVVLLQCNNLMILFNNIYIHLIQVLYTFNPNE